ncbi:L,D-transpeptidase family protein [Colwelliaceae bacterium BS250]
MLNKVFSTLLSTFALSAMSSSALAIEYQLPSGNNRLVGEATMHTVQKGDFLQKLAKQYHVGLLALMEANPDVDPLLPKVGSELIIPTQLILPFGKHDGILINLSELRLYFFDNKKQTVNVFPVGIGKVGFATPTMTDKITEKRKDPNWYPTPDKREEHFKKYGVELAKEIKAGPNNPLGDHAMRIGHSYYLIHGTNQAFGIGMRASSGCVRMNPEDIEWLFNKTNLGTKVRIIDHPIKMTYQSPNKRVIEVHAPLSTPSDAKPSLYPLTDGVNKFIGDSPEDQKLLKQLIEKSQGIPTEIN